MKERERVGGREREREGEWGEGIEKDRKKGRKSVREEVTTRILLTHQVSIAR